MTEDGVTTSYTYNSLNQLLSARSADGDTVRSDISYSYDANGNLKEETDRVGNIKKSYAYDADSRLSSLQIQKEGTTILTQENLYNGDGQRICRQENGSAVYYYYQDGSLLAANNGNGSRQSFHLLGLEGNVIASGRYDGSHAGEYGIYNKDGRGSTTSIVNADGRSVATYEYTDFGETTVHGGGAFQNEICYTGGVYDESTGLYYLNARYYDPKDGRFLTQDTYRGEEDAYATWHLYTYCANNPVNYVDPSGHEAVALAGGYYAVSMSLVVGSTFTCAAALLVVTAVCGIVWHVYKRVQARYLQQVRRPYSSITYGPTSRANTQTKVKQTKASIAKQKVNSYSIKAVLRINSKAKLRIRQSKGGKQKITETWLDGVPIEEVEEMYRNAKGEEKNKLKKQLKAKNERNKQSRKSEYNRSKGKTKKLKKPKIKP